MPRDQQPRGLPDAARDSVKAFETFKEPAALDIADRLAEILRPHTPSPRHSTLSLSLSALDRSRDDMYCVRVCILCVCVCVSCRERERERERRAFLHGKKTRRLRELQRFSAARDAARSRAHHFCSSLCTPSHTPEISKMFPKGF